jgi:hypothetical protein
MSKRRNEYPVFFDVDNTLVMWCTDLPDVEIKDPYGKGVIKLKKHNKHIKLMKDYHARGCQIIVWSAGGRAWAKAVVKALKLKKYVDIILTKPVKLVDDLDCKEWMGPRIYLEDK